MRTGKVIGAEALIRWQHPERGLLPPGMFLPVIEDHPLAIELGEWVIETALAQMESWQAAGLDISAQRERERDATAAAGFCRSPARRCLPRIPGSKPAAWNWRCSKPAHCEDVVQTSQVLQACREIGVSMALDDFGIGYSSLTYLKRLPGNVLKIDQSFVSDMVDDPENLAILEGVLGIAVGVSAGR